MNGITEETPPSSSRRKTWPLEQPRAHTQKSRGVWFLRFMGPAALVSVGYMDPGNWATDLEGGARFGYQLLWVLLLSNLMALLLQGLSARLGIVTGCDLATACRTHYPRRVAAVLWLLAEVAIIACDIAELVGSAVALNLLFGIPVVLGAILTVTDVLVLLTLQKRTGHALETIVLLLIGTITLCLAVQLYFARPQASAMVHGLVPRLTDSNLYVALGMLGATVMPHNLYLQSSLVSDPREELRGTKRRLLRSLVSTGIALNFALLLNGAILVVASAVFASHHISVTDLGDAHRLLTPLLGTSVASTLFAVGLLCASQSATITGTLAGQIVMEGFVRLKLSPVHRRLLTRGLAIVPAVGVLAATGPTGTMPLLIASQIVLSLQLPFAMVPLIRFTNSKPLMGQFASGTWVKVCTWICALLVIGANGALILHTVTELKLSAPHGARVLSVIGLGALCFLGWISFAPLKRGSSAHGTRECTRSDAVASL